LVIAVPYAAFAHADPGEAQWAGSYGGLAIGGRFSSANWTTTQLADPPSPFVGTTVPDASSPGTFSPSALRLGAFVGYNWQAERWVFGAELDAAWAQGDYTHRGIPGCTIGCFPGVPGPGNDTSSVRSTWDAALLGRVGYLVTPKLLVYGTGGIAWQSMVVSATCESTLTDPVCLAAPPFAAKTDSQRSTLAGWTIGAGVEHLLSGHWLIRAQYRYADFGSASGVLFAGQPATLPGTDAVHYDVSLRTHIATIGLVYKF
jgi:outer membrane immunogenic protein